MPAAVRLLLSARAYGSADFLGGVAALFAFATVGMGIFIARSRKRQAR